MRIADSRESDGRRLTGIWFELEALCQSSLVAIELVELCKSRVGSAKAFGTLYGGRPRLGPSPRTTIDFDVLPLIIKPAIPTCWSTCNRVEIFNSFPVRLTEAKLFGSFPEASSDWLSSPSRSESLVWRRREVDGTCVSDSRAASHAVTKSE